MPTTTPDRERKLRANELRRRLARAIPEPRCELSFRSPFELLVAAILSAQSTDKMVNRVTPELLARFPTPEALAQGEQTEVEALIKRTGFFRSKAKAIRETSRLLVTRHGGQVPRTLEQLVQLRGRARAGTPRDSARGRGHRGLRGGRQLRDEDRVRLGGR